MQRDEIELKNLKTRQSDSRVNLSEELDLSSFNLRKRSYLKPVENHKEDSHREFQNLFNTENEINTEQASSNQIDDEVDDHNECDMIILERDSISFSWKELIFGITLKNNNSTARDHMANERTFLTWIRTAASFITFGIGILQIYRMRIISIEQHDVNHNQTLPLYERISVKITLKVLIIFFIVLGLISTLFGAFRYFQVQGTLLRNYYPVTRLLIFVIMALNFALMIMLLVLDVRKTI